MLDESISPIAARALLAEDFEIDLSKKGRRYGFRVSIGPYLVAEGTKTRKRDAMDAAADAVERTQAYLVSISGSRM